MTSYRIGGGIAAIVLLGLIGIVSYRWWTWQPLVQPSTQITNAAPAPASGAKPTPEEILAARTGLQRDRFDGGVDIYPELARGNQQLVASEQGGVSDAPRQVDNWLRQRAPDSMILQPPRELSGITSVPYREMNVLEQPQGRDWRETRNGAVRFGGGWIIFGVGLALALFLFARGRIRIADGRSDSSVLRFGAVERANHWMTATAFVILALTGLVILYGQPLLLPVMGEYALSTLAGWSAWLHMASAVPFVLGVLAMAAMWTRGNLLSRADWEWLKRGGGFLNDRPDKPPARRFNAGQKLVFWGVVLGGLAALVTGLQLMFPFYLLGYDGMQWAQLIHAAIGLLMIALIIGHIYIGTVGMEGAIDAMWSGRVDRNWAHEHHKLWLEHTDGAGQAAPPDKRE